MSNSEDQNSQELYEFLNDQLKTNIDLSTLDLSCMVTELNEEIIETLHEFENLRVLDLSNNKFHELPINLDMLDSVEELDLINVEFDDLE